MKVQYGALDMADALARQGLGHEDILVQLRHRGLTRFEARAAVFGKLAARRMEDRDMNRQVAWRLATTTAKLRAKEAS